MKNLLIVLLLFTIISCDHGLAPPPKEKIEQGISGTIYYRGALPDSLLTHRLIASKVFRKFSSMDEIISLVLWTDSIQIHPAITYPSLALTKIDSIHFKFVLPPELYKYIAVVQQHGSKWKIVGVYSSDSMRVTPDTVIVETGKFVENVNIYVDYDNLPPQPFSIAGSGR